MAEAIQSKSSVSLPAGVSLLRVGQVLLDAWEAGAHQWTESPVRAELKDQPSPALPIPRDALELFRLLETRGTPYLLIGGMAMLTFVPGRNTKDVDLLMSVEAMRQVPELKIEDENEFFARGRFRSLPVDFLLTNNPLFKLVQERFATRHRFAEQAVPCATVEGLIVLKLYALPSLYRQGNLDRAALYENDIAMLLIHHTVNVEQLLGLVAPCVEAGDLRELRKIVDETSARARRLRQHADPQSEGKSGMA